MDFNATFLVSAISFILFTVVMNKIFYKPVAKIMEDRELYVKNTFSDAKFASDKADAILKDKDEKLEKTLAKSKEIIAEKTNEAKLDADKSIKSARLQSLQDISTAKDELALQKNKLSEDLKPEVKVLAGIISSKLLGMDTKIEDIQ